MRPSSISCGATMNFTSGLSFIRRISSSSSGFQVEPATKRRLSPLNRSMMSICLAAAAISATRSKRVSPATITLSKPSPASSFFRLLVLHEHHVEGLQRLPPHAAVGAEEDRVAAEDGRDDIGAHLAAAQVAQQVKPEFVFYEDCDFGMRRIEEPAGVARRVDRQVEDVIHALVILADFVARKARRT